MKNSFHWYELIPQLPSVNHCWILPVWMFQQLNCCLYLRLFIQHTYSYNRTLLWMLINWPISLLLLSKVELWNLFKVSFFILHKTNLVFLSLSFSFWSPSCSCWMATTTTKGEAVFLFTAYVSSLLVVYKWVQHFIRSTFCLFFFGGFLKHTWINNNCEEAFRRTFQLGKWANMLLASWRKGVIYFWCIKVVWTEHISSFLAWIPLVNSDLKTFWAVIMMAEWPSSLGLWVCFLVSDAIKDRDFCCVLTTGRLWWFVFLKSGSSRSDGAAGSLCSVVVFDSLCIFPRGFIAIVGIPTHKTIPVAKQRRRIPAAYMFISMWVIFFFFFFVYLYFGLFLFVVNFVCFIFITDYHFFFCQFITSSYKFCYLWLFINITLITAL